MKRTNLMLTGAMAMALSGHSVLAGDDAHKAHDRQTSAHGASMQQSGQSSAYDRGTTTPTASSTQAHGGQKSAQSQAPAIVIGELMDTRTVKVEGAQSSHQLLKLRAQDGATVLVDVGAAQQELQNLKQGDRVIAVGTAERINDRNVIVAQSVGELHSTGVTGQTQQGELGSSASGAASTGAQATAGDADRGSAIGSSESADKGSMSESRTRLSAADERAAGSSEGQSAGAADEADLSSERP